MSGASLSCRRARVRGSLFRVKVTLAQLRQRYVEKGRPLPAALEEELRREGGAGAHAILAAVARRRRENRAEGQRLRTMLRYERALWASGVTLVAGVDEAGMSPLAGPVAAGAVIFHPETKIPGVDDSKKVDPAERDRLAPLIKQRALAWAVAFVEPEEIDRLNIYWAGLAAMERAIAALASAPQHLLIDGRRLKSLPVPQQRIVGGDGKSLSIAAASILAKTSRDARMVELDAAYPGYGFARHKGYPVPEHLEVLATKGASPVHRRSFAPVREALGLPPLSAPPGPSASPG
jgi:ribonuclease HII